MISELEQLIYAIYRFGNGKKGICEVAKIAQEKTKGKMFSSFFFKTYCGRIYSEYLAPTVATLRRFSTPAYVNLVGVKRNGTEIYELTEEGKREAIKIAGCLDKILNK